MYISFLAMSNQPEPTTTPPTSPTGSNAQITRRLDRGEGRIAYDVTGAGPLVIAVPGMGDLRRIYRHLVPALVSAGFRVATMDLRGHGDSDTTFTTYDDRAAATDIVALAEHLGGPAMVLGNSMGAGAAVLAAADRAELVSGLVLIGPFVRDVPVAAWQRLLLRAMMGGPWARRAWLAYLPSLYPTRRDAEFTAHRAAIAAALARPAYRAAFQKTTHTSHAPAEAVLDRVTAPTLVVMGSKDPDFPDPQAEARLIADRLHGSSVMVPDAGHYPQAEFPELTTPAIVEFAQRLAPGA